MAFFGGGLMGMERRKEGKSNRGRIQAVLKKLNKQAPLTVKQEKFCNDACVERFLRAKGDNVKKAAKHLRAVLCWRTENLIADEFSTALAEGVAYVAGHDDEARPVMVFRIKQDYLKFHSQKMFVRLLVFTLEVAISSMSGHVDQFVLLFDASFFRSVSAFLNMFMGILKIISDYYPGRLHKAFVIDPPSLFPYLWKGVRPFVELSAVTTLVSSLDFQGSPEDNTFASYLTTTSLRFDPDTKFGNGSTSSRFSFNVSHLDPLKPWYLSTPGTRTAVPSASPSLIGASPLNARSFSFASPAGTRSTSNRRSSIPSTPSSGPPPTRKQQPQQQQQQHPRTPRPSFLQSPAIFFSCKKEGQLSRGERERESFRPFLRFYRRTYDEMVYRSKMRPPHGGLISVVSSRIKEQSRKPVARLHQRIQDL